MLFGRASYAWAHAPGFVASKPQQPYVTGNMMSLLSLAFDAYSLVVLVSVICSWLNLPPDHPVLQLTSRLVEPVLAPIRRLLPSTSGIDFSPMLLLFALRLLKRFVLA